VSADLDQIGQLEAVPAVGHRKHRRAVRIAVVLVVAAIAASVTWWQVTARTYALSAAVDGYTGVELRAGPATELCAVATPRAQLGDAFILGNSGDHTVTGLVIDPILRAYVTTASIRAFDSHGDLVALPDRIAPHATIEVVMTMTVSSFPTAASFHVWTDGVRVHYRVLGTDRDQQVTFASVNGPQYIGLQAPGDNGSACPATTKTT
jgi:hypothetical protein